MHLRLIKNTDESKIITYKIVRVVYAETNALSLPGVEALVSMIANLCIKSQRRLSDIIEDKNIFESLNKNSARHPDLLIESDRDDFQMCLRTVQKMMNGHLPDSCSGATRFHRSELMPDWATALGYVDEVDNLLFYI